MPKDYSIGWRGLTQPVDLDSHPLVRSVLELKERVKEHMSSSPNKMLSRPWEGLTQDLSSQIAPTHHHWHWKHRVKLGWSLRDMWHHSFIIWGHSLRSGGTTVPSAKLCMEDQLISQDASQIEATIQTASTTASVVKLTSPIVPPDWTEDEKQYVLVVTMFQCGA